MGYDRDYMRVWMRQERVKRKARGDCVRCGTYKAKEGLVSCSRCLNLSRVWQLKNNVKKAKAKRESKGIPPVSN